MTIHDLPTLEIDSGTIFVTCRENHRLSIATTIERLIDMLDALEPDPDLEPSLGFNIQGIGCESHQEGAGVDDREHECEDEGAQVDGEYSHGWANEGPQDVSRGPGTLDEGEPDLGFVGIGTGWREGEGLDDREQNNGSDDEREAKDGDDEDSEGWAERYSQGANDPSVRLDAYDDEQRSLADLRTICCVPQRRLDDQIVPKDGDIAQRILQDRDEAKLRKLKRLGKRRGSSVHIPLIVPQRRGGGFSFVAYDAGQPSEAIQRLMEPKDDLIPEISRAAHYRATQP